MPVQYGFQNRDREGAEDIVSYSSFSTSFASAGGVNWKIPSGSGSLIATTEKTELLGRLRLQQRQRGALPGVLLESRGVIPHRASVAHHGDRAVAAAVGDHFAVAHEVELVRLLHRDLDRRRLFSGLLQHEAVLFRVRV